MTSPDRHLITRLFVVGAILILAAFMLPPGSRSITFSPFIWPGIVIVSAWGLARVIAADGHQP